MAMKGSDLGCSAAFATYKTHTALRGVWFWIVSRTVCITVKFVDVVSGLLAPGT